MKQNILKKFNKQLLKQKTLVLLLISTHNSLAHTVNNTNTKIQIYSNYQNIDMITNTLIVTGNIVIHTDSINIYADKALVTYAKNNNNEKTIDLYGNPVICYQFQKNKNQILATALHISYKKYNNTLLLKGEVYLKKEHYVLKSDCIMYMIKNKYIKTCNHQNYQNKTKLTINLDP